jgi:phosphatidylethanolamine/phosphatidyl-N-methylethanolamine N-methyltransferase
MGHSLSGVAVANSFVDRVYARLTPIYDLAFGPVLQAGRIAAVERMPMSPGDRILEVGIGTGLTLPLYPADCRITGIDLSARMLDKARARVMHERLHNVRLLQMDAADLRFDDGTFDIVYAPYTISVVPEPIRVAREMRRVCKSGGTIMFLNHFRSARWWLSWIERAVSPLTVHVGFRADLDLHRFLRDASLSPVAIEPVNVPQIWTLVTCVR